MTTSFTYMIVVLGVATVVLSVFVAASFIAHHKRMQGDGKRLTASLVLQLLGEAVIGGGTTAFAIMAHTGHLENVSTEAQSVLRLGMFFCTATTTWHLWRVCRNLTNG